jgi:hypothetical protein
MPWPASPPILMLMSQPFDLLSTVKASFLSIFEKAFHSNKKSRNFKKGQQSLSITDTHFNLA